MTSLIAAMLLYRSINWRKVPRLPNVAFAGRILVLVSCFLAWTGVANAATRTAATGALPDVSAAVSASARGDTVLVPAGTFVWSGALTLTKGINLFGAGVDVTTIRRAGLLISIAPDSTAIANEETIRIEGFTIDGSDSALNLVRIDGAPASASKPFKNLAIGGNKFKNTGTSTSGSGALLVEGQVRGVIFRNSFDRCNVVAKVLGNDSLTEWSSGKFPFAYGSSDNLYFEDNAIFYSTSFGGSDPGWIEVGQGARLVVRYCAWNMANANQQELWDIHGFQNWGTGGQTGTMLVEFYGNTASNCKGYRWINHRGSQGLFFNNILTGTGGNEIDINLYNCTSEVPGASGIYQVEVNNTYCFNNTRNGLIERMIVSTARCGLAENQHYWNYNATFNGTSGIGRGTAPPTGNGNVGVAFWVASTPTPTVDPSVIQNGTLYRCNAPNTWTAYYTPYLYPHPMQSSDAPQRPQNPTSLRIVQIESTN